jgi:hypothetical protein
MLEITATEIGSFRKFDKFCRELKDLAESAGYKTLTSNVSKKKNRTGDHFIVGHRKSIGILNPDSTFLQKLERFLAKWDRRVIVDIKLKKHRTGKRQGHSL